MGSSAELCGVWRGPRALRHGEGGSRSAGGAAGRATCMVMSVGMRRLQGHAQQLWGRRAGALPPAWTHLRAYGLADHLRPAGARTSPRAGAG